jgi:glutaredoxin
MSEDVGKKVSTVPQVIVDDEYIGGYTETERFIKNLTVSS